MSRGIPRREVLAQALLLGGLGLIAAPRAQAIAASSAGRHGTHGMVLFGGLEGLYTSHMPMFHVPHDVQAVFRVRVTDRSLDARLREALAKSQGHWSIEPQPFDLDRAAPDAADRLAGWRADIYEGHFERGGTRRHAGVDFVIEEIPLHARLDPQPRSSDHQDFLCLGAGLEHFLVKRIDQRPDVDLIGRFRTAAPAHAKGVVRTRGGANRAAPGRDLLPALAQAGVGSPDGGVTWIYTETGDLT